MKIYFKSLELHIKTILEYKMSFILSFLAQIFVFFTYYFLVIALFDKFSNIKGFTLYEVLLCFGIIQLGYSTCEVFVCGLDHFDRLIISGDFDRLLTRPKNLLLQILCSEINIVKLSRVIQSIIVIIIALNNLNINWEISKVITLIFMIISSTVIYFGIFTLTATYCFFTTQGLEIRNLIADGGKYMAQYPIGVFSKTFIWLFTFIIPYGCVNYYPLLYLLGKTNKQIYMYSPLITILYLIPCILIFHTGVKKYSSVGS